VRRRFARAYERAEESVRRGTARTVRDGWIRAVEASDRVRACLLAVVEDLPGEVRAERRGAADSAIAALDEPWLRAGRECLAQTLDAATSDAAAPASVDFAAGEEALRMICVRAELLAGLETPPEDLERRREHQMRRLVQSMGQGVQADPGDLPKLALEWLAVGPVEPAVQQRLRARFERCIEALA
jgi:hypothetical protein